MKSPSSLSDAMLREALMEGERVGQRYLLVTHPKAKPGWWGTQHGTMAGSSLEFHEYREYQPGDDIRMLDWSAYGRTDKLIVKKHQQEVEPTLDLVLDGSRSMALGEAKPRVALGLTAALATAATQTGFRHQLWQTASRCEPVLRGNERPAHWQTLTFAAHESPAQAFIHQAPHWRTRSLRILISDLLWPGDPMPLLTRMAVGATSVAVIQVLSKTDVEPAETGFVQLVDKETGAVHAVHLDEQSLRLYREAMQRHMMQWHAATRKLGISLLPLVAEELIGHWRLDGLLRAGLLRLEGAR